MSRSKWFLYEGRLLEVRDLRIMTTIEIWIYGDERPVARHSILRLADACRGLAMGTDLVAQAMDKAVEDIQHGRFVLIETRPAVLSAN